MKWISTVAFVLVSVTGFSQANEKAFQDSSSTVATEQKLSTDEPRIEPQQKAQKEKFKSRRSYKAPGTRSKVIVDRRGSKQAYVIYY